MKILFINNDGGGFAEHVEIRIGTMVRDFFAQQIPTGKADDYLIRVNRQPTSAVYVLQEADRVSFTPVKIEGAC